MKPAALATLATAFALQLLAAALSAQSIQDLLEDQNIFAGSGRAAIRRLDANLVVVGFDDGDGLVDRLFTIAAPGLGEIGDPGAVLFARLTAWSRGLLLLNPVQKTAYLFTVAASGAPAAVRDAPAMPDLESLLRDRYTVIRFGDVGWIASRWGRLDGLRLDEIQQGEKPALRSRLKRVGATLSDSRQAARATGTR